MLIFKLKDLLNDFRKANDSKKMNLFKFIDCIEKHGQKQKKYNSDSESE